MDLVSECFSYGKFWEVGTPFRNDYSYDNDIMSAVPLIYYDLKK